MENSSFRNAFALSKENWFNILSYIDLKSFLSLEKTSKYFRKLFIDYYIEKNTIRQEIIDCLGEKNKDENIII